MSWEAAKNKKKCHLKSLLYEIFTVFAVDFQCIFQTSGQLISSVSIRHTSLGRTKLFQLNELLSILSIQFTFPKFPQFGSCLLRFRAHVEQWSISWQKTPLKIHWKVSKKYHHQHQIISISDFEIWCYVLFSELNKKWYMKFSSAPSVSSHPVASCWQHLASTMN